MGMAGVICLSICQSISTNIVELTIFIGVLGICVGVSVPFISVYLAEISPVKNRGRYFLILCASNPLGLLIIIVVAYFILTGIDEGPWRYLFYFICGFSCTSLIISILKFYESPRYLAINNKIDESYEVL